MFKWGRAITEHLDEQHGRVIHEPRLIQTALPPSCSTSALPVMGWIDRDDKRQTLDRGGVEKERGHHQKREFILIDVLSSCIERLVDFIHFLS